MSRYYINYEEALKLIENEVFLLESEEVSLDSCLFRVLREDLVASFDNPQTEVSAMDGYALSFSSLESGKDIRVVGEAIAGELPLKPLKEGEAVKIFTGAPIPRGADTVIPVEIAQVNQGFLKVKGKVKKGANVRPKGEDYKKGEVILEKGILITPAEMGIIASLNRKKVKVSKRPKVGVIITGKEVVEPGSLLTSPAQVVNANAYTLIGLVKEVGGEPTYYGIVDDDYGETLKAVDSALNENDVVITSGGIPAGDYDFVKEVVKVLGVENIFYKVKVKPGKPVFFGKRGEKYFFGLPGFPVSVFVGFNVFVYPFLRSLQGAKERFRRRFTAFLREEFRRKKADRLEFVRVSCRFNAERGVFEAFPLKKQSSGSLSTLRGSVFLMPVEIGVRALPEGSKVEVIEVKPFV